MENGKVASEIKDHLRFIECILHIFIIFSLKRLRKIIFASFIRALFE